MIKPISTRRNTAWVNNPETAFTRGKILAGKNVFFIRIEYFRTTLVDPLIISVKQYHIAIPAASQTTNGTSFTGCTLNPTLKMTQKTKIVTFRFPSSQLFS